MKPQEYWRKRSEELGSRQFRKADSYVNRLQKEYAKAWNSMQKDIEAFYMRFADNNEISYAEAKKLLDAGELKEFRMTLEEFTAKAKDNADHRWTKELNNVYYRTRINRLEALQIQLRHHIEMLAESSRKGTGDLLGDTYTDTYYRTLYEIQKGTGIGVTFAKIDSEAAWKIISNKWLSANYSERIWANKAKLIRELDTNLAQSLIRGDNVNKTARILSERMQVSFSNAARLVQTESAHIVSQATFDSYKASGVVEKYEFLATLDRRTSKICRHMDGKVFLLSEKKEGVNFPPLHPRCRSTTVAFFDDEAGVRAAKGKNGKTYYVPGDIHYEEWYKQFVD
ncbi:phage head morphogenesis protein [Paenibacillus larvae subsp. pulvifaciens]|uniref:Phage head morphogenesis protein n=1 Tax=Paenibacillus larvae subsp. pulvifaciens TaxID=1477 RepID=A0A1V0UPS7_9BACL|nr:minor capsid protein [Paenibacillus larvae]ARF66674.1 phage head morphogenesis protein [Paenibacillus larvae subsp. pulvifaciens]ARF67040.1 phage head morphogenesis protein [Paenibacillus larvae subsp. pulvifaciens]ARF69515.1 phage head morphogenesis protein [Paenibacillus larvae subsp. pulvifaciens]ARF69692.1 phage head morphogenesis protein [Paenibacillus larvae subsp. pulvifaciens]